MDSSPPDIEAKIRSLAARIAASEGVEFVDLEFRPRGQTWFLRLFIDRKGGVDAEECARVSRQVGTVLDVEDLIPHRYRLEVSSPGIDRPLTGPADFRRHHGRLVRVRLRSPDDAGVEVEGRIGDCDERTVRVEPDDGDPVEVPIDRVLEARLTVDWGRKPATKTKTNRNAKR